MRVDRIKLIAEMARKDLTVVALAEKSGVTRGTISNVRSGKNCSKLVANALAAALGVDVMEIMEDD